MDREEIYQEVKKILAEELGVDEAEITPEKKIQDDLGADSLAVVELMMKIEECEKLKVKDITDEEADKIVTVADLVDAIIKLQKDDDGQAGAAVPK